MAAPAPLSPGSPRVPAYPYDLAVENALDAARQADHITDPELPLIGFSNGLPGYTNACFRNALVSLLINLPPFSGWIVSNTQGQLDSSPTAHLLENVIREYFATHLPGKQIRADKAIQRLYNYTNLTKPINPKKINARYPQDTQQDAVELLYLLLDQFSTELMSSPENNPANDSFSALTELLRTAAVACVQCGRGTHRRPSDHDVSSEAILRTNLSSSTVYFKDLIAGVFAETPSPAYCPRCGQDAPRTAKWKILRTPEVLFIDVDQTAVHPTVVGRSVKLGLQVPTIPEHLDLGEYLHDVAPCTAQYRLFGVVNHQGATPYAGHYVSHVRHISGNWFQLDDSAVSASSVANLQKYNRSKRTNQMIPRLIAYVKIHGDEDEKSIATRAAKFQPGPRAFKQSQIIYDEWMTVEELRTLCKSHMLVLGNSKTGESMRKVIDSANSATSTFATRLKDWLVTTNLSTGHKVVLSKTKAQVAAQLRAFMKTQPARTPAQLSSAGREQQPDDVEGGDQPGVEGGENPPDGGERPFDGREKPPAEGGSNAVTEATLDAANAQILDFQLTIADLHRKLESSAAGHGVQPVINERILQSVNTDDIRELIQRLPTSPNRPQGTKRRAGHDISPETRKRRAIQLAGETCSAIDAGRDIHNADGNNQNNVSGLAANDGRNGDDRLENLHDSDQENRQPHADLCGSSQADTRTRCHQCPTIAGEIHHMHAQVCGCQQHVRVSPPTASEIASDMAQDETNVSTPHPPAKDGEPQNGDEEAPIVINSVSPPENGDETARFLHDSVKVSEEDEDEAGHILNRRDSLPDNGDDARRFLDNLARDLEADEAEQALPVDGDKEARIYIRSGSLSEDENPHFLHPANANVEEDGDDTIEFLYDTTAHVVHNDLLNAFRNGAAENRGQRVRQQSNSPLDDDQDDDDDEMRFLHEDSLHAIRASGEVKRRLDEGSPRILSVSDLLPETEAQDEGDPYTSGYVL